MRNLLAAAFALSLAAVCPAFAQSVAGGGCPVGASSCTVTATGSPTARALAARAADVVNVKDFGAVGDDATDDTAAINAAIAYARGITVAKIVFPQGTYYVSSPLNLTGLNGSGIEVGVAVEGYGAIIDAHNGSTPVMDLLGSRALQIRGISIKGTASIGMQFGRINAISSVCDDTSLSDVSLDGNFSVAGIYVMACETSKFHKVTAWNNAVGGYAAIFDGYNHFGVGSTFITDTAPANTMYSFNEFTCDSCDFRVVNNTASVPLWITQSSRMSFSDNSYLAGPTGGVGVKIYQPNAAAPAAVLLRLGLHFESNLATCVQATGESGKTFWRVEGFGFYDNAPQCSASLFGIDGGSSLTSASLRSADIRLSANPNSSPVFDNASKWSGSGTYMGPASGDTPSTGWNLASSAWGGITWINLNPSANFSAGAVVSGGPFTVDVSGNVGGAAANFTGNIVGSGGLLQLTNGTSNFLSWADVGIGTPTFTTQSVGTKLVLYQAFDASDVDFGFGIASGTLWASVPQANGTYQFAWYGGTTKLASLSGTGAFSATSYLAGATVGVTCSGTPTSSFASTNGIVTHC